MNLEDRQKIACIIRAMSELTSQSDARLARILGVNRTNLSAFLSGKRSSAIGLEGAEKLLLHYGFRWVEGRIEPAQSSTCPTLSLMAVSNSDRLAIEALLHLLIGQGASVSYRPVPVMQDGEFVLLIRDHAGDWCAVAIFEEVGGEPELLDVLRELGVRRGTSLKVSESTLQVWRECGPRRQEVLAHIEELKIH